jgi:hypothetical protein
MLKATVMLYGSFLQKQASKQRLGRLAAVFPLLAVLAHLAWRRVTYGEHKKIVISPRQKELKAEDIEACERTWAKRVRRMKP